MNHPVVARILDMKHGEVVKVEIDRVIFVKEDITVGLPREESKWEKIGREPYEFKKGDIVHDGSEDSVFTVLSSREIELGRASFYNSNGTINVDKSEWELIVPVEFRFDKEPK